MHRQELLLFAVPTLIWGSTWYAITLQLGVVPPEWSVAYRFALASLILFAVCAATRQLPRFPPRQHAFLALLGMLFFGLNYVAIYQAERHVPSGLVAVLFSTIVLMTPYLMRVAFGTPVTRRALVAALLGVGGVALVFLPALDGPRAGGLLGLGIAMALVGTLIAALGNIVAVRNNRAGLPILPATAWGMAYGSAAAATAAVVLGVAPMFDARPGYVLSLLYLAFFGSVVAFVAYLTLLKRVGAGPTSFVAISTPVMAMLVSTVVEDYRWSWPAALGVVLAMIGNYLALRPPRN